MLRTALVTLAALGLWACAHADSAPANSQVHAAEPMKSAPAPAPAPAAQQVQPAAARPDPANGGTLYAAKCASCHGATGNGNGADAMYYTPAPTDFTKPAFQQKSDAVIVGVIKQGKGNMPGFGKKLTDAQLADVVAYLRTLK